MSDTTARPPFAARNFAEGANLPDGVTYGFAMEQKFPKGDLNYNDPAEDNTRRAKWGLETVTALVHTTYNGEAHFEPLGQVIGDQIAYLHHLCDAFGLDWETLLRSGDNHYQAEVHNLP